MIAIYHSGGSVLVRGFRKPSNVPKDSLDELILGIRVSSAWVEIILCGDVRKTAYSVAYIRHTAKRMFVIHNLLSAGYRVIMVDKSSMRFGIADRGATPANPNSTARMIGTPCVSANVVFALARSSFVAVRLMIAL